MYEIRLKQIECFLDIAETLSFTESANNLSISQPLASKWIRSLEQSLDTRLFRREKTGLSLTKEGAYLKETWGMCYPELVLAIRQMKQLSETDEVTLRIGALKSAKSDDTFVQLLGNFQKASPEIRTECSYRSAEQLRDGLSNGAFDLIFTEASIQNTDNDIVARTIGGAHFYIAISRTHRLSRQENLTLQDLAHESFFALSTEESPASSQQILACCKEAGFTPRSLQYVPNLSSLALSIIYQNGVTLTNAPINKGYENQIRLYDIGAPETNGSYSLQYSKAHFSEGRNAFLSFLDTN